MVVIGRTGSPFPAARPLVDVHLESAYPTRRQIVDERADHGDAAADDAIQHGTQDYREQQAKTMQERQTCMQAKRNCSESDRAAEHPGDQPQHSIHYECYFEGRSGTNVSDNSHNVTSETMEPNPMVLLSQGRKQIGRAH